MSSRRELFHDSDSENRYAQFFDFLPLPAFTVDRAGIVREIGARATELLGRERRAYLGRDFASLFAKPDRAPIRRQLARCAKNHRSTTTEATLLTAAAPMAVELVIRETAFRSDAYWVIALERTHAHRTEEAIEQLGQAERAANESNHAKDVFIAVLGHELRAPLAAMAGVAEVLKRHESADEQLRRLGAVLERNVAAQARLVNDLFDVTRIMRKKIELQRRFVDLHDLAHAAVETFALEIAGKPLTIGFDLGATRHVVDGDETRLLQVLWNLVKNAIKFTPAGGRICLRSWNNRGRIAIEVSDDGVGIEPAVLARMFQPFEQASASGGGVGLGLAITAGLVELHGGKITAASPGPGKGARFVIELDVVEAGAKPEQAPAAVSSGARRGARILLVEDNEDISGPLETLLKRAGYQVEVAATVQAALTVDLDRVELMVSDLDLPDGSGFDLVRALHQRGPLNAIAVSGSGGPATVEQARDAGFNACLPKPIDLRALLAAIADCLPEGGRPRSERHPDQKVRGRA